MDVGATLLIRHFVRPKRPLAVNEQLFELCNWPNEEQPRDRITAYFHPGRGTRVLVK